MRFESLPSGSTVLIVTRSLGRSELFFFSPRLLSLPRFSSFYRSLLSRALLSQTPVVSAGYCNGALSLIGRIADSRNKQHSTKGLGSGLTVAKDADVSLKVTTSPDRRRGKVGRERLMQMFTGHDARILSRSRLCTHIRCWASWPLQKVALNPTRHYLH